MNHIFMWRKITFLYERQLEPLRVDATPNAGGLWIDINDRDELGAWLQCTSLNKGLHVHKS